MKVYGLLLCCLMVALAPTVNAGYREDAVAGQVTAQASATACYQAACLYDNEAFTAGYLISAYEGMDNADASSAEAWTKQLADIEKTINSYYPSGAADLQRKGQSRFDYGVNCIYEGDIATENVIKWNWWRYAVHFSYGFPRAVKDFDNAKVKWEAGESAASSLASTVQAAITALEEANDMPEDEDEDLGEDDPPEGE